MQDIKKTKAALIQELRTARRKLKKLEAPRPKRVPAKGSAGFYSKTMANMAEGVHLVRLRDCVILYANPQLEKMFAYEPGELAGKHVSALNAGTDGNPEERAAEIRAHIAKHGEWRGEIKNAKGDGSPLWCRASVSAFDHPEHGKVAVSIHTDITDIKLAEERLRGIEEKWRSLVEGSPDHIMLLDKDFRIRFINRTVPDLTKEEVIGRSNFDFIPPAYERVARECYKRVLKTGMPDSYSTEYRTKAGETRHFDVRIAPLLEAGRPVALISSSTDVTERSRWETALKQAEAAYHDLYDESPAMLASVDAKTGKVKSCNRTMAAALGVSQDDIIGLPVFDLYHPDSLAAARKAFASFKRKGEVRGVELRMKRKDGSPIDVILDVTAMRDEKGNVLESRSVVRDVTEQKRAEAALRESEAGFRTLFEGALDGIAVADIETKRFIACNKAICDKLGYTREQFTRLKFDDIHPVDALPAVAAAFARQASGGSSVAKDIPVLKKDDTVFFADINSRPITLAGRRSLLGVFRDVTERKRTVDKLRESESRWRSLIESSPDHIIMLDRDFKITFINRTVPGLTVEHVIGKSDFEFLPSEYHQVARDCLDRILKTRKPGRYSTPYRSETGETRYFDVRIAPIVRDGRVVAFMKCATDITVLKRAEEDRLRTQNLESLGVLAGGIAHDFNNLLTAVLGNLSLAKMEMGGGADVRPLIEETERAAHSAKSLTHQLLTFSKGGSPVKKVIALAPLLKESVTFATRGSHTRCDFDVAEDLRTVDADAEQVAQVLSNLAINAVQAMSEGGVLRVTAENVALSEKDALSLPDGPYVRVRVKDQGVGIPAEQMAKVFAPYYSTKENGRGLGLATCRSIVARHGGHIAAESEAGAGATFTIHLPASSAQAPQPETKAPKIKKGEGRILIMDDDRSVVKVLARMVRTLGYEAESAPDGAAALEAVAEAEKAGAPFDVVFMDLTIPGGMGGEQAIKKLAELHPGVKAIVSSGYATGTVMSDFAAHGFSGMLAKPYRLEEVSELLSQVLGGSS
ncbi:MAG: PAS domain S-box protein [Elusimicrobiota bacterium]